MKLNLGCGEDFRPGWLNVDCRPLYPEGEEFLCCDLADLDARVEDGGAEEIAAVNVLEYVPWRELDAVLVTLGKKLRPDGLLFVQVPDLGWVARGYAAGELRLDSVQRALLGDQGRPADTRRNLWDAAEVARRLAMIGLRVERLDEGDGRLRAWGRRGR